MNEKAAVQKCGLTAMALMRNALEHYATGAGDAEGIVSGYLEAVSGTWDVRAAMTRLAVDLANLGAASAVSESGLGRDELLERFIRFQRSSAAVILR